MTSPLKLMLPAQILFAFMRAIPLGLRKKICVGLALAYYRIGVHRRLIAINNLKRACPDKEMGEIRKIARGVYRNMAIVAAEFVTLPFLRRETISDIMDVEGIEHCVHALEKNKGLLLFGAHFGNWELGAIAMSLLLKPVAVIYRPLDNSILENFITWIRQSTGNNALPKDLAMRPMLRILKQNGIVGLLIDQNTGHWEGVFVDYFGMPACTTNGLALLALHTDAPVIPTFIVRQRDGRYRLIIGEEVDLIRTGDRERDVLTNTGRFTAIIEDMVRQYPDHWLWIHQRWKEREPAKTEIR